VHRWNTPHDNVIATVKASPSVLTSDRELVFRNLAAVNPLKHVVVVNEPADDAVDYGLGTRRFFSTMVRAKFMSFTRFVPKEGASKQCKVVITSMFDPMGCIPIIIASALSKSVSHTVKVAGLCRSEFEQDLKTDARSTRKVAAEFSKEQTYSAEELTILNSFVTFPSDKPVRGLVKQVAVKNVEMANVTKLGVLEDGDFVETEGGSQVFFGINRQANAARGKCVVDEQLERLVAFEINKVSRSRARAEAGASEAGASEASAREKVVRERVRERSESKECATLLLLGSSVAAELAQTTCCPVAAGIARRC
jgi:hypothetical protein